MQLRYSYEGQEAYINASEIDGGGVTSAKGFRANAVNAKIKPNSKKDDLAIVVCDNLAQTALVATTNIFCAAPIVVSRENLSHFGNVSYGQAKCVLINSGNANAATGDPGIDNARRSAAACANLLDCAQSEVMVASTGVIGVSLPIEKIEDNVEALVEGLHVNNSTKVACSIMTTDTIPKEYAISYESLDPRFAHQRFTVGGMAKGSGMIMPNMATMISVITTDAPVPSALAYEILHRVVSKTFNKVSVDSDTSTNDCCYLMSSASAKIANNNNAGRVANSFNAEDVASKEFEAALLAVCTHLARMIAKDGEGATKLITVNVTGAQSEECADLAARAIANSPLVKTAIYGRDANWGRIVAAAGKSGAKFLQENVDVSIMGIEVCKSGLAQDFNEEHAAAKFEDQEIVIDVHLGAGPFSTTIWTCDFTHDYVTINGDYRT